MEIRPSEYDYLSKVLVVGDSGVGKTTFLVRYVEERFLKDPLTTIGVDHKFKTVYIPEYDKHVKLQIWDTAGQEKFRTMTRMFWSGVSAVILMFSLTNKQSFNHVESWLRDIKQQKTCKYVLLVGNKSDCPHDKRQVTQKEGQSFADENGLEYIESSAKLNENVEVAFTQLATVLIKKYEEEGINSLVRRKTSGNIVQFPPLKEDDEEENKKNNCCYLFFRFFRFCFCFETELEISSPRLSRADSFSILRVLRDISNSLPIFSSAAIILKSRLDLSISISVIRWESKSTLSPSCLVTSQIIPCISSNVV
jgi:Ras-related protein Rab-1A